MPGPTADSESFDRRERTRMEEELSLLVDTLPGLIWTAKLDGDIDFVNKRWCDYAGLAAREACAGGWRALVHPDDAATAREHWDEITARREHGELELRLRRFDGEYRWFLVRISPLTDASGSIVKWCGVNTDIDDRKQAEKELRTLRTNFRQMCESIPGLVCTMDASGEVEVLNRQLLEYFGRTTEEMRGWGNSDAVHPDDLPRVRAAFTEAVTTGNPYEIEHRCRRADGVYRWFHVRALPVRGDGSNVVGWFVLLIDIEDRKQAEWAIQASERNLAEIVNTIPALAWSALPSGLGEFFNQHYLDYVGLTPEQAKGNGWAATVHPNDLPSLLAIWQRCLETGTAGEAEARLRRFDGEYRWFLFRVNPLRDESGQIVKWYCVNTDIDDRKRAEDDLRRSEAFLAEGERLNQSGTFALCLDPDQIIFSEQAYRIFELEREEPLTVERIAARVHPEDQALMAEKLDLARRGSSDLAYEIRLTMPDESLKYLRSNAVQSKNRAGKPEIIGAIQDVTERRLSEQALGKVRSELAYMTRVASLGELTASIAHEVNQPLSGIITNANTCLRMLATEPPNLHGARETARRTIRDGNRASDVITRLRALFARKNPASEPVDLNEATREVVALSATELNRGGVSLRAELAENLPLVIGDRVQLQQVILNLLLNASAAMSGIHDRPRQLSVRTELEAGARVRLTVRDAGVGLDPKTVEQLFEAFYTTKTNGMGLGLSVSRSIVETHRGRLWAEPNEGPGATFAFSIPHAATENA